MKLINADEFMSKMEGYAITEADWKFCEKVKFALGKEEPAEAIPIEFLDEVAKDKPGLCSGAISLIKGFWKKRTGESDGQIKSEHNGSSQGTENVAADRPPFDGFGTAPDRGLRTAEGLQTNGLFCIQKNAGRRKGTARDRIAEAVSKIDNLIEVAEPIEEIDDICRKTANITECANMITENMAAKNYQRIITLAESCDLFADRANDSGENVAMMMRMIMKLVGEIRAALAMPEQKED